MTLSQLINDIIDVEILSLDESLVNFIRDKLGVTYEEKIDKIAKLLREARLEFSEVIKKNMRDQFSPDKILEFHKMVTSDVYSSYADFWKSNSSIYASIMYSSLEKIADEDYM